MDAHEWARRRAFDRATQREADKLAELRAYVAETKHLNAAAIFEHVLDWQRAVATREACEAALGM